MLLKPKSYHALRLENGKESFYLNSTPFTPQQIYVTHSTNCNLSCKPSKNSQWAFSEMPYYKTKRFSYFCSLILNTIYLS